MAWRSLLAVAWGPGIRSNGWSGPLASSSTCRAAMVRSRGLPTALVATAVAAYKTSVNGVRPGNVLDINGRLLVVLKATTVKNAQRRAQVTSRNEKEGALAVWGDCFLLQQEVDLMSVPAQYLYRTGNKLTVMKTEGYDNLDIDVSMVDGGAAAAQFLTEGMPVTLQVYNEDKAISLRLPETVQCTVVETDPSFKGQQAAASAKPAKTDTGAVVQVPPYVEIGDKIVVNVQEQRFVSRER